MHSQELQHLELHLCRNRFLLQNATKLLNSPLALLHIASAIVLHAAAADGLHKCALQLLHILLQFRSMSFADVTVSAISTASCRGFVTRGLPGIALQIRAAVALQCQRHRNAHLCMHIGGQQH